MVRWMVAEAKTELLPARKGSRTALTSAVLVALTWAVFGQTIGHQFINYDDPAYVLENPHIRGGLSWHNLAWAFTHVHAQNWHPLTSISHMLDCQLFGVDPRWPHAENVLLHSLTALLLFLGLQRMTAAWYASAFVAAIFAIHPLRAESVAWIAERKDVLSGLFFVATLWCYVGYVRRRSAGAYALVLLIFACGLLSKPMLVTTPLVLLLLDYWPLRRLPHRQLPSWKLVVEKVPFLALSLGSVIATMLAQNFAIGSAEALPVAYRLTNAVISYAVYLGQTFWPHDLVPFYVHAEGGVPSWQWGSAAVVLIGITVLAVVRRKNNPYLFVGWLWYLVMLIPVIGVVQVGLQAHADRYTYLPQIGVSVGLTWWFCDGARSWRDRAVVLVPLSCVAVALLAFFAWKQTSHWRDTETLWRYTLSVTPKSDVAETGLAGILVTRGRSAEAIEHYRAAIAIRAGNPGAQYGLANVLAREGKTDEAIEHYQTAVELQPDNTAASNELALLLANRGDLAGAAANWENTLRFEADDGNALNNLAWVLATASDPRLRDPKRAVQFAERANRLAQDDNAIVLRTLAVAYAVDDQFERAATTAERGMQIAQANGQMSVADDLRRYIDMFKRRESPFE